MKIAIIGTVGVPGRYGGFETLAENLVRYHARTGQSANLTVWCSSQDTDSTLQRYENAELRYVSLHANGLQSVPYDVVSMVQAIRSGHDRLVLLGVSGAIALPLVRLFSRARVITNIDGIEWKRKKWSRLARAYLRMSERVAVRFSHEVVADNQAIADHVRQSYGADASVIAYGGDHALAGDAAGSAPAGLPDRYALALCRVEPENNLHLILAAAAGQNQPVVIVGNWTNSAYGRDLREQYQDYSHMHLLDPVYDPDTLYALRRRAWVYLHGHSAGGTNPSLVEMMHFGIPVLAYDCSFNRYSTDDRARYFKDADALAEQLQGLDEAQAQDIGADMRDIARERYTWDQIGADYFALISR